MNNWSASVLKAVMDDLENSEVYFELVTKLQATNKKYKILYIVIL